MFYFPLLLELSGIVIVQSSNRDYAAAEKEELKGILKTLLEV